MNDDIPEMTLSEISMILLFIVIAVSFFSFPKIFTADDSSKRAAEQKEEEFRGLKKRIAEVDNELAGARKAKEDAAKTTEAFSDLNAQVMALEENFERGRSELEAQLKSARLQLDSLTKETRSNGLRSKMTPSCEEVGLVAAPLGAVVICGKNRYRFRGKEVVYEELLSALARELETGEKCDCRHSLRVSFLSSLSAAEYNYALMQLRTKFYTHLLPAE